MNKKTQSGFSLVELIMVVTIIGIIAAIGVPNLQKGIKAADNGAAFAQMRVLSSSQLNFYTEKRRFARLTELDSIYNGMFGRVSGSSLSKGRFIYEMSPLDPTDAELKDSYTITASAAFRSSEPPVIYKVSQSGEIVQVSP